MSICCFNLTGVQNSLSQPLTVQPGQPLTIYCKVSYSVTSYYTAWIRQPAEKPLEWIGDISSTGGTTYANSVCGRLEISKDNAQSMSFLKLSGLRAEDSAVYYCARQRQNTLFT
uniref:Ig-like domain-containing protein n=1 Tax=Hucho hucho TaxID=62062 RepID=A0A4W5LQ66_9TELE